MLEPRPQLLFSFANVSLRLVAHPGEERRDGDPECHFARDCRAQRRQATALFVTRDSRATFATQKEGQLLLGKAGFLAVCPEVVLESLSRH